MVFWLTACAVPPLHEGYVPCRIFGHLRECVGVPMASKEADAAAKRFLPPVGGRARIYLARPYMQESKKKSGVFLNGKRVAVLGPATYAMFDVPPGRNVFRVNTESDAQLALEAEPGRSYYLQYQLNLLFNTVTPRLTMLQEENGRDTVLRARRVIAE